MTKPSPFLGFEIADEIVRPRRPRAGAEPPGAARWKAAEDRLYPLITVDPALYEAALTLVCEVADVLRGQCGTVTELVGADAAAVLARCPSAPVLSALGFDPGAAFDAACACRWRELTAEKTDAELQAGQDGSR
ncbi:MAG: hypothetical protein GEV28_00370 [Actinophytocola sp.]|uniref:hypothetical protein n=1 Tax=Actinophytocola sp. TaxID=1872138 RepID=UPI001323110F|nr:hypothetical protein [Actinophytocola sp.]MPZ78924.1 hypothetical protein [Actinophytocola sp.]